MISVLNLQLVTVKKRSQSIREEKMMARIFAFIGLFQFTADQNYSIKVPMKVQRVLWLLILQESFLWFWSNLFLKKGETFSPNIVYFAATLLHPCFALNVNIKNPQNSCFHPGTFHDKDQKGSMGLHEAIAMH